MSYAFQVERKNNYLHVRVQGENTPETALKYLAQVHDTCGRLGCPYVLIEENLAGPSLGITDIFKVVTEASKNVRPVVQMVAYVDANPEHDIGRMQFAENVAINRGVKVRMFGHVRDAEQWLVDEIARAQPKSG